MQTQPPELRADPAIEALVRGTHGDAFAVLGPHATDRPGTLIVRTFQPHASSADLVRPGVAAIPMTRVHPDGLFEATVQSDAPPMLLDYRLRIREADVDNEIDDPYRYGPLVEGADLEAFARGEDHQAYRHLGSRVVKVGDATGVQFAVWAPNAARVSVIGDFNRWDGRVHPMRLLVPHGVWAMFIPGLKAGECYKYEVLTRSGDVM